MIGRRGRGLAAGAAGTTALNAATYVDMLWRARPPSDVPTQAVSALLQRAETALPGDAEQRSNRLQGLGALAGICTGVGVGLAAMPLAPILRRLPLLASAGLLGALAMAASDLPASRIGVTDPASWSSMDWASDAAPHLAYGLVTAAVVRHRG